MKRIGILGDIGSGKSYFSRLLGYPRFDADVEVKKIYKNSRKVYLKIKKEFPKKISSFPVKKLDLSKIILEDKNNGTELTYKAGDAYSIQPGHDGWVVGNEPAVVYEFHGMWGE